MEPEKMKRYRVTGPRGSEWAGIEIEVPESANEDELHEIAWDVIAEYVDYGLEEIEE